MYMPKSAQPINKNNSGYMPKSAKPVSQGSNLGKWFTNGKTGFDAGLAVAGNIMNIPSYAIGGILNQTRNSVDTAKETFQKPKSAGNVLGTGVKRTLSSFAAPFTGIANKTPVMSELPKFVGVDPNSKLGLGIGFAGELATPDPIGMAGDVYKAYRGVKNAGRISGITNDAARTLLEKSYKLSASDISKVADAIGVTDEAQKATKVIDYLEGLGLQGANRTSLKKLNTLISNAQEPFNALTKTGNQVSRKPLINSLLDEAIKQEKLNTPQSRRLAEKLFAEAQNETKLINSPLTDTDLTKRITQLFSDAGDSAIADPLTSNLSKQIAKAGQTAREVVRPGATEMGRNLRRLTTASEVLGKKANTGLGTQLVNALKPSAFGAGAGALYGYSTGQNPFKTAVGGALVSTAANNPKVLNTLGKTLSSQPLRKATGTTAKALGKIATTAFRTSQNDKKDAFYPASKKQKINVPRY